ncbi:antibiotic biosynthesis monooxygenase [Oceanicola sp. 502str15]|uniref:antibiotic biosynthesis monooxygenase n=1 Tax=Oceanicola sp. 502str15 TaxID=2696061 RepID=UPI0020941D82|nr:antibiotic biosynthesis monooxygenase [Oceanicola sp. 502str15]MCO6384433.1 antibiotic biosynthesis monooxygenase [Oceanicola sp. 502str15]
MPVITANDGTITQINVFLTDATRQDRLIESLADTARAASDMEGWVSSSILRSTDGRKVTNYLQFESAETARRVTRALFEAGLIQQSTALGRVDPGEYEVVFTLGK